MKRLLLLLACIPLASALAQESTVNLTSQRQPARVSLSAFYQRYENGGDNVSELSFPLSIYLPIGRSLGLSLWTSPATAGGRTDAGQDLERLGGFGDVQASLSYARRLGAGSLVLSGGVSLPSGRRELTREEFETSRRLSLDFFDFRVPNFGQGLSVSAGATWAVPLSSKAVFGLGASYQYHGAFRPLSGIEANYEPGDEVLFTAGLDFQLSAAATLSADITSTRYAADKLDQQEVFDAGNKLSAVARFVQRFTTSELQLLAHYRNRARSSVLGLVALEPEEEQTLPNQLAVMGQYRLRWGQRSAVGFLVRGRVFEKTWAYDSQRLLDVGLKPELALSPEVRIAGQFIYTLGSLTGLSGGVGLDLRF